MTSLLMLTNLLLALKEMGEQQFMEPHDISFVEDGNNVTMCVADHGNNRIQVFTANNDIIQYSMTIRTGGGGGVAQRTSIAAIPFFWACKLLPEDSAPLSQCGYISLDTKHPLYQPYQNQ